ncbi:TPA: hypothetical protein HA238_06015 [Candidatus Micrarchaeota archaeon]|nr:hypothetical protein [Candidatus Micrarchaeota archaeon]
MQEEGIRRVKTNVFEILQRAQTTRGVDNIDRVATRVISAWNGLNPENRSLASLQESMRELSTSLRANPENSWKFWNATRISIRVKNGSTVRTAPVGCQIGDQTGADFGERQGEYIPRTTGYEVCESIDISKSRIAYYLSYGITTVILLSAVAAVAYILGYPPPHRLLISKQRGELVSIMDKYTPPKDTDSILPAAMYEINEKILLGEAIYRERHRENGR